MSGVCVGEIVKAAMGEAPSHYLIRVRMEHAKKLLEQNEDYAVAEIAERVGYEDAYHFSKLFKKAYGISPMKYRNSVR